jgi:hypothetical protein
MRPRFGPARPAAAARQWTALSEEMASTGRNVFAAICSARCACSRPMDEQYPRQTVPRDRNGEIRTLPDASTGDQRRSPSRSPTGFLGSPIGLPKTPEPTRLYPAFPTHPDDRRTSQWYLVDQRG